MLRNLLAVIAGYIVMAAIVFLTFSVAYLAMGPDRAYEPGVFDVTMLWVVVSIVLGLVAAILGGLVSSIIGRGRRAPALLAAVVLVLGFLMTIPTLTAENPDRPEVRTGDVGNFEAMQYSKQPTWVSLLNPALGAIGVLIGGSLRRRQEVA